MSVNEIGVATGFLDKKLILSGDVPGDFAQVQASGERTAKKVAKGGSFLAINANARCVHFDGFMRES